MLGPKVDPGGDGQAMASIGTMKGLQSLALFDCTAITNNGMQALSALTALTFLAVAKCSRISDKGFIVVEKLGRLKCLNVQSCFKVGSTGIISLCRSHRFIVITTLNDGSVQALDKFVLLLKCFLHSHFVTHLNS